MILAFDLGGTRLKAAAVSPDGKVAALSAHNVNGDFDKARGLLVETGQKILAETPCLGVGLSVPGLLEEGIVVSLPGKFAGIEGFDLPGFLNSEFDLPTVVVNDAIAYGAGEAAFGAGSDFRLVVVMTIGTGVGVTVTYDGVPTTRGVFGGGILGGQIPISESTSGPADTSGRQDTIEALCCAERIVEYSNDAGGSYLDVQAVYAAFESGEDAARAGVSNYREHLTRALVALAHAHCPEVIVLGGGPMAAGNPLLPGIEEAVNERLFGSYHTKVSSAALGDAAALCGLARIHQASESAID